MRGMGLLPLPAATISMLSAEPLPPVLFQVLWSWAIQRFLYLATKGEAARYLPGEQWQSQKEIGNH